MKSLAGIFFSLLVLFTLASCAAYELPSKAGAMVYTTEYSPIITDIDVETIETEPAHTEVTEETTVAEIMPEVIEPTEITAPDHAAEETTAAETSVPEASETVEAIVSVERDTTQPVEVTVETPPVEITEAAEKTVVEAKENKTVSVIINVNSGKFHLDWDCGSVKSMKDSNRLEREFASYELILAAGYEPCGRCADEPPSDTVSQITAESTADAQNDGAALEGSQASYEAVLNTNSKKIHLDAKCRYVTGMSESNRKNITLTKDELDKLLDDGYSVCKSCSKNIE